MKAIYRVSVVKDPQLIRDYFPDGAPWEGSITPRIRRMLDGKPRNDPETGEYSIPRISDPRNAKTAALIALTPEQFERLKETDETGLSLMDRLGMKLYESRDAAMQEHPELEWSQLATFGVPGF